MWFLLRDYFELFDMLLHLSEDMPVQDQLEVITASAIKSRATDIHIEPDRANLIVRYRVDGVLQEAALLPKALYPQILSQLKITTGLPLDIANTIQEGRFTIFGDKSYDVRVSMIPGGYGQTVVLRILQADIDKMTLAKLGMDEYNLQLFESQRQKTSGLVLVTGPTSAGKSTTLYSALNTLNQPGVKIITIEDPIEYNLPGILQTSVNEENGYTFATALKALLRQNPNIILIGEIRDKDTAKVAIQAAATGHLLLSTLHTNDAVSAVLRLYDLGIGLSEIATFVNGTVAQRIIRTLDPTTKQPVPLSPEHQEIFRAKLPERYHTLIGDTIYAPQAGDTNTQGYQGMTAIFEVFVLSDTLKQMISSGNNMQQLKAQALAEGMNTLEISGIVKVLQGVTDPAEISRVLGIDILSPPIL